MRTEWTNSAENISRTCLNGTVILKLVRSILSISGVNRKGLRVPILTFTRGYSNGKIPLDICLYYLRPGAPDPCVTHTCGASRYHTSLREKDVRPSEHKGKPGAHTALL